MPLKTANKTNKHNAIYILLHTIITIINNEMLNDKQNELFDVGFLQS